jgi:DNA (cytosine-5)-methyltransferase 1
MKALGVFIFGGSATFGVEEVGYKVDRILEMTEDMKEENAFHFVKNRPDIPVVLPSEWENAGYLNTLRTEDYDLLYSNCPCSSLSQLNRNASLHGDKNAEFYRVFKVINHVLPKTFFIENAHTLLKLGYPILKDMVNQLKDNYRFTIIRDYAGAHGVPMKRMRTLVVGWRNDLFDGKLPLLHMKHQLPLTTKDAIGDLFEYDLGDPKVNNHELVYDKAWSSVEHLYKDIPQDTSALLHFAANWNKFEPLVDHPAIRSEVEKTRVKLAADKRIWDKSPWRLRETDTAPSITSVTRLIHPVHDRSWTLREYARLMGYPDSFKFYEGCKTHPIQVVAQGVPKNFVKYITSEIYAALKNEREFVKDSEDKAVMFQHHTHGVWRAYTLDEINTMEKLDHETNEKDIFNDLKQ